jgi:hypothetical protein
MTRYFSLAAYMLHKDMDLVVYLDGFRKSIQPFYSCIYQPATPNTVDKPAHHHYINISTHHILYLLS